MTSVRVIEEIAADYIDALGSNDHERMRRLQHEETCLVLFSLLQGLSRDPNSFVHEVAIKGGMVLAGSLGSPRSSADIDFTYGKQRHLEPDRVISDVRAAGAAFDVRVSGALERGKFGDTYHLQHRTRTSGGASKLEISAREDLILSVRSIHFVAGHTGVDDFVLPGVAITELVSEKIRCLWERDQPRDLYDLHYYLCVSGEYVDQAELLQATNAKLSVRRPRAYRSGMWKTHLDTIGPRWRETLIDWMLEAELPDFETVVAAVDKALRTVRM